MNDIILLLGGNEGNVCNTIDNAEKRLTETIGSVMCQSSFFESEPWGFDTNKWFVNKVLCFQYNGESPFDILKKCQTIETELGRIRNEQSIGYESRSIDIDILFIGSEIIESPQLIIPHPHLHKRAFTLLPLAEIIPNFIHPIFKRTITQLLQECNDLGIVRKIELLT